MAAAQASDTLRAAGLARSPLDGLPLSVKDLFDVAGQTTRVGIDVLRADMLTGSFDERLLFMMPPVPGMTNAGMNMTMRVSNGIADDIVPVSVSRAFAQQLTQAGWPVEVVELPTGPEDRFQPTVAMLEALDQPVKGLIVASPANPTGTMLGSAPSVIEIRPNFVAASSAMHSSYDRISSPL